MHFCLPKSNFYNSNISITQSDISLGSRIFLGNPLFRREISFSYVWANGQRAKFSSNQNFLICGPIFEYCDFWILRDNGVKMAAALWKLIYATLKWQC
jgi:hypothetical protein